MSFEGEYGCGGKGEKGEKYGVQGEGDKQGCHFQGNVRGKGIGQSRVHGQGEGGY